MRLKQIKKKKKKSLKKALKKILKKWSLKKSLKSVAKKKKPRTKKQILRWVVRIFKPRKIKYKFKYTFTVLKKIPFGVVLSLKDGVAKVSGLYTIKSGEMVCMGDIAVFNGRPNGMVLSLHKGYFSVAFFEGGISYVSCGDRVYRSRRLTSIPLSMRLFGRTLDSLAFPLDGGKVVRSKRFMKIDTKAVGIIPREAVREPMQTGVVAVDALTPIGCGQRELIIGDRQTGKTSLALDSIISQLSFNSGYCIYVGVGQKKASIAKIHDFFFGQGIYKKQALRRLVIVSSSSSDSAVLQFLAPYTGCTIGEWVSRHSARALIVYDDLSKQAIAYRQMSLLLRRPPGREAYPGDVGRISILIEKKKYSNKTLFCTCHKKNSLW